MEPPLMNLNLSVKIKELQPFGWSIISIMKGVNTHLSELFQLVTKIHQTDHIHFFIPLH